MRIGIDAKWFFDGPPSGRNVVRNLVEHIIRLNTEHELFIILDKRARTVEFPFRNRHVHLVYVWGDNNLLANLFVVPLAVWRLRLDVVVFQNFVPVAANFKRLAFIHDVIFLSHPQFFTLKERLYLHLIKPLSRFATRICTVSHAEKERIVSFDLASSGKIDVIHNGVSSAFQPRSHYSEERLLAVRERHGLPGSFLLYVGRLNERKNIMNLLKAMPLLENKTIPLVIVGAHDWKMFDINTVVREQEIEGRVHLAGFVEDEDLPLVYAMANIFCFVSFEEGFGLPALEAMASGVPVVVSKSSSLPEVCGDAGNYVDAGDPHSIAAMIDRLLADDRLYEVQRNRGLERARQFSWENSAKSLLRSVEAVCEKKGG